MKEFLYTASECRTLDANALNIMGVSELQLMQRAANAAMALIEKHWSAAQLVCIYCGPGNNGGDGYLLAELIIATGRKARLFALAPPISAVAKTAKQHALAAGIKLEKLDKPVDQCLESQADLIVDALFGHGLTRPISPSLSALFERINQWDIPVLALDVPSGINSDTGAVMGAALKAQCTLSFVAPKIGLVTADGPDYAGDVCHDKLAISSAVYKRVPASFIAHNLRDVAVALVPVKPSTHKGDMGHLAVVGGQLGMVGAAILAASAAMRSGAGRVTVVTDTRHINVVQQSNLVLMTRGIPSTATIQLPGDIDAMVLGPGLGHGLGEDSDSWSESVFNASLAHLMEHKISAVIDADGLNILASQPQYYTDWVLTPHPKEAANLLHCSVAEVQTNRPQACQAIAQQYGGVCVLKGCGTITGRESGRLSVCTFGNWGMATAGSGDVLSGIIGALLAYGLAPEQAASLAVVIHACAGDKAAKRVAKRSLIASDIIAALGDVFKQIERFS